SNAREIDLLNAAFTAMMPGYTFVTEKEYNERLNTLLVRDERNSCIIQNEQNSIIRLEEAVFQPVDLDAFHKCVLVGGYIEDGVGKEDEISMTSKLFGMLTLSNNDTIQIFVKMLDGKSITIECGRNDTIEKPCGWKRFALKVSGKYDNGNNRWLGTDANAWPVSYHGTNKNNSKSIAEEGFLLSKGKRFAYGHGIYSISVAKLYASQFTFEGNNFLVVLQNRVNFKDLQKIPKYTTKIGEYWISKKDEDVRPYGICIKKI
ncbi:10290_t:CDS:2, partial [Gigaspora rosea]